MRSPQSLLAAAVLCAAASFTVSSIASAQQAAPDHEPLLTRDAAGDVDAVVRTLAVYQFAGWRDARLPARVTLADSAGTLVASYQLADGRTTRPMAVALHETDVVLRGATPAGELTLRLDGQNDPAAAGAVAGRWSLGAQEGALHGSSRWSAALPR